MENLYETLGQAQSIQNLALFYSLKQSPQSSNSVSGVQPPFYYFHQRPSIGRFSPFTSSLGAISAWSQRYFYVRYKLTPSEVHLSRSFPVPRLWNRVKPSLDVNRPLSSPKWFLDLERIPEKDKWNLYALVVEPILSLASASVAEQARYDIDDLGICVFLLLFVLFL